jgi:hypothetical protein
MNHIISDPLFYYLPTCASSLIVSEAPEIRDQYEDEERRKGLHEMGMDIMVMSFQFPPRPQRRGINPYPLNTAFDVYALPMYKRKLGRQPGTCRETLALPRLRFVAHSRNSPSVQTPAIWIS